MFGSRFERALERSDERIARLWRDSEDRHQQQLQLTREVIRRNELVFKEGMRTLARLVEVTTELRDDIRAQRQGFLALLDRLDNGGEAGSS